MRGLHHGVRTIALKLTSFLVADRVYKDVNTGKSIIAGTFNLLNPRALPWAFTDAVSLYAVFIGPADKTTKVEIRFRHIEEEKSALLATVDVEPDGSPVEILGAPLPVLLVKRSGIHVFEIFAEAALLGSTEVIVAAPVRSPASGEPSAAEKE